MSRARATAALLGVAALAALATGCVARDTVATAAGIDVDQFCAGTGPPVLVNDACTGDVAEAIFRQAVCACGDLTLATSVTTDGFDSRVAPWAPGGAGGDLGGNGAVSLGGMVTIGGDAIVAGAGGLQAGPMLHVQGDLDLAGPLGRSSSAITVGGAARVGGTIDVGSLGVAGALTTAPGAIVTGAVTAATRVTATVAVPPPCRCDPDEVLDVAQVVADHRLVNHDAALGLAPDAYADVAGDVMLELPCGRYYLDRIQTTAGGSVTIRATGRTVLLIGGDVTLDGDLTVEVAPGAELDLFISGFLNLPGAVRLGDPARPRDLRLYLAAAGSINVSGGSILGGNLYAPAADIQASAPLEVFGALLVNRLNASAGVTVHYDRAIEVAGDRCEG